MTAVDTSHREQVEEMIFLEAELADERRYEDWLALWDEECTYWVPSNLEDYDPSLHLSIIYDDRARLEERCFRLAADGVHAQEPASKTSRIVGNVRIGEESEHGLIDATARVLIVELRMGRKSVYAAKVAYSFRRISQGLCLRSKKVVLLDCDEPLGNMTFLI